MKNSLKNIGILALLLGVMGGSYAYQQRQLTADGEVLLPVVRVEEETLVTSAGALDALESYRQRRETQRQQDVDSLKQMIQSEHTTLEARQDAQETLERLVEEGEKERAMEGAMTAAGFSPCLCVVEGESITLMVGRKNLAQGEANLLLTLAQHHAGAAPEKVMILTGESL